MFFKNQFRSQRIDLGNHKKNNHDIQVKVFFSLQLNATGAKDALQTQLGRHYTFTAACLY